MKLTKIAPTIIAILGLTIMIMLGVIQDKVVRDFKNTTALLNEYEYMLSQVWEEKENCKNQLGVFYKEPK